ncbi:monovalent cation/H+ antiporter complex subunit F [Elioraea thermophila]|uniref:monovalent cation/H+ antiporter complex subunit F n=1 Tax=Elioraea thermophila TaxID=2185104 RepID=UPI000DF4A114|nr:monovalent cation/H+ antiporter complex subunit F [Elioraea thermophila]
MSGIVSVAIWFGWVMIAAAFAIGLARLVKGPHLPDRIVALDMLALTCIAAACLMVLSSGIAAYLDFALVMALVSFLSTVAFARYVEWVALRRARQAEPPPLEQADD